CVHVVSQCRCFCARVCARSGACTRHAAQSLRHCRELCRQVRPGGLGACQGPLQWRVSAVCGWPMIFPPLKCPDCGAPIARSRRFRCDRCGGEFVLTNSEINWYYLAGALVAVGGAVASGTSDPSTLLS